MTAFDKPLVGDPLDNDPASAWIRMVNHDETLTEVGPEMTHWAVNPAGRAPWLQRRLFGVLRWLGAQQQPWRATHRGYHEISLPPASFLTTLYNHVDNMKQMFEHEPEVLYVGGRQYREMMRLCSSNSADAGITAPFWFNTRYHGQRQQLLGLKVNIIPWFDGVLAL